MTVISVTAPVGRIGLDQRRELAESLTDAVLVTEVGQPQPAARVGFQVHFRELAPDAMAIGGRLVCDQDTDVVLLDIAVMDGDWPEADRAAVIRAAFAALEKALGPPSAGWWINFRTIDEGSWGLRTKPLSILELVETGLFSDAKAQKIRDAVAQER